MERIVKGIWVPIEIWEDDDLCLNEKALLMDIDSFTARGRECYISNDWICERLGVAKRTAQMYLKHLIDRGLVRVVKFDGRVRYLESNLPSLQDRSAGNCTADVQNFAPQTCNDLRHTYSKQRINKNTEKERSINTSKEKEFSFRTFLIDAGVSADTADQWLEVRKAKKMTNSALALKATLAEIAKSGHSAEDCIRECVIRSWGGFKAEWLAREEAGTRGTRPDKQSGTAYMLEQMERRMARQSAGYDINDLPDEQ